MPLRRLNAAVKFSASGETSFAMAIDVGIVETIANDDSRVSCSVIR